MGIVRATVDKLRFTFANPFFLQPKCMRPIRQKLKGHSDPVRFGTMALAVQAVLDEEIPGDFAEGGVWQGHTSAFIHSLSPEKTIYLFDTFQGFPEEDLQGVDNRFRNTSIQTVLNKFKQQSNVVVCRGRFPDTTKGLENNKYACVSIDFDLEGPTFSALEYFYPRLSPGGFIFLHDFNSEESNHGVSKAFKRFSGSIPEFPVFIPDSWGSAVIRKSR